MKTAWLEMSLICLGILALTTGCSQTDQSAADQSNTFVASYDSTADVVTTAADQACEDLKLSDINSTGSKIDGQITAKTSDGDDVSIQIQQTGDNVSKLTIQIGSIGDQGLSRELADRIKAHLAWLHT